MGTDIFGILQKRIEEKWVTIPENTEYFTCGYREREFLESLTGDIHRTDPSDPELDDLYKEILERCDGAVPSGDEKAVFRENNIKEQEFSPIGYLTVQELMKYGYSEEWPLFMSDILRIFGKDGKEKPNDCRILVAFQA